MHAIARALALAFFAGVAGLSPAPRYIDCGAIAPDLVTFVVDDPTGFPAWSDGGILASFHAMRHGLVVTTDRPAQGIITIGNRYMWIDRHERTRYALRLRGDTIRSVLVCYRP